MRTDENRNPTAFTTAIAKEAGLVSGVDYQIGDPFYVAGQTFYTARLLGDPIAITIKVIDKIGFYTAPPIARWTYIAIPYFLWLELTLDQKKKVIGYMYQNEGGTEMRGLFA
jgi:hypothetical protein